MFDGFEEEHVSVYVGFWIRRNIDRENSNDLFEMILSCVISISNSTYVEVASADTPKNHDSAYSNWYDPVHGLQIEILRLVRHCMAFLESGLRLLHYFGVFPGRNLDSVRSKQGNLD